MKNYKKHILVWLIYLTYTTIADTLLDQVKVFFIYIVFFLCHNVFIFYNVSFCLQRASFATIGKVFKTLLLFIVSFFAYMIVRYFYRLVFLKLFYSEYKPISSYVRFNTEAVVWYFQMFFYAIGYHFLMKYIKKERELRENAEKSQQQIENNYELQKQNLALENDKLRLEQENLQKEQEQLHTEYAYLRSQINPHFLHNTLNFFYSKSLNENASELSEGILLLSEIMRYSLQKEETGEKEVSLADEIEHIENVIKINQLRFDNTLKIVFNSQSNIESIRILPLVLITLVENAFKHGDLKDALHPVSINLEVQENAQLIFTVSNKKKNGPKELSHGIGLTNTKRRLDIAYPNQYQLITTDTETTYSTTLQIQYKNSQPEKAKCQPVTAFKIVAPFSPSPPVEKGI